MSRNRKPTLEIDAITLKYLRFNATPEHWNVVQRTFKANSKKVIEEKEDFSIDIDVSNL